LSLTINPPTAHWLAVPYCFFFCSQKKKDPEVSGPATLSDTTEQADAAKPFKHHAFTVHN